MEQTWYQEISPERNVEGVNFTTGEINFNWTFDSRGYWNPYRSYIKMRIRLNKPETKIGAKTYPERQLSVNDRIAPSMFLFENLFQSMAISLNSIELSSISDYVPQVSALKYRMYKSDDHLNSYGSLTDFSQSDVWSRINDVSSDGYESRNTNSKTIIPGFVKSFANTTYILADDSSKVTGVTGSTSDDPDFKKYLFVGDQVSFIDTSKVEDGTGLNVEEKNTYTVTAITSKSEIVVTPKVNGTFTANKTQVVKIGYRKQSRRVQEFEIIAKPPLGFFDIDGWLPSANGIYNLRLTPHASTVFQKYCIESVGADKVPGKDFNFQILSMNMYLMKGLGPAVIDKDMQFTIKEVRAQSQNITTNSLTQKTFQVHPQCVELSMAFQYPGAGYSDTTKPATKFLSNGDELNLERYWISFGGRQLPSPIPSLKFEPSTDFFTQRYVETLQYSGGVNTKTAYEPFEKWKERGVYFHHAGYGMGYKPDRVYISTQFSKLGANKPNILLFDHYTKKIAINIKSSVLQNVQVE